MTDPNQDTRTPIHHHSARAAKYLRAYSEALQGDPERRDLTRPWSEPLETFAKHLKAAMATDHELRDAVLGER